MTNKVWFVSPVALVLAGCGSDLDLVKGGVMEFNKTRVYHPCS